ncbi:UTP--glucose-1-phosphate uridylyltransferase GalU [Oceanobacillus halophilus]|uniref:UTP--glucose-1-phosphate uridylyltransferase n=1 Tax=Oceanobacillus halophilus TaxID=930130 RepID=A0A494ZUU7_9BACI|nr:UTP--glucose-1-phosphate uridylyltransferase GalU [Oceanobacillus halophilus]RKQ29672.1 UTP--glucose-1-phosphate uridylyltransferase [Oceanobacillus halophilus]
MRIRKAIIPAAGLGTRFLPASKAQAKEMLPIVDKPTIQYIVEEAVASGIEEIVMVIGRGKHMIEDHFDKSYELEDALQKKNKTDLLEEIQSISKLAKIYYVRQQEPLGLGDAILCAKSFIGNEPFAVLLGDDIVMSEKPCLKQLLDVFNYYQSSVIAVQHVPDQEVHKYGIIKPKEGKIDSRLLYVDALVEKPEIKYAPSNYAIMGRYVLKPEIFNVLSRIPFGAGDELQLTDAINELNAEQAVLAYNFEGRRFDIGDKIGFIKATIELALQRQDTREEVVSYLKQVIEREHLHVPVEGVD